MTTVTISYHTADLSNPGNDRLLGREIMEDIDEVLVPLNQKNTPIFITKAFNGESCKRWQVECVRLIEAEKWGIWLVDRNNSAEIYLSETLQRRSKSSAQGYLRKGAIVIVEFGHIHQTLSIAEGVTTENTTYFCSHLSGEMHKRRPAIVVSADRRGVKVVPITSQEPDGFHANKSIFELESASTKHINEFNPSKGSFVLCEMIQTVSPTRILPPLAKDLKFPTRTFRRDDAYIRKISPNDLRALEDGLLTAVGMSALKKRNQELLNENANSRQTRATFDARQAELTTQLADTRYAESLLQSELSLLKQKHRILSELYLSASEHTAVDGVDAEVAEYLQQLDSRV